MLCLEEPFYLLWFGSRGKVPQISLLSELVRVFDYLHRAFLCSVPTCNVTGILCTHSHAALQFGIPQLLDYHQWAWKCFTRKGLLTYLVRELSYGEETFWRPLSLGRVRTTQWNPDLFLGLEGTSVPLVPLEWFKASQRPPLNVSCVTKGSLSLTLEI